MKNLTTAALFFLAAGVFTSVTILGAYQILFAIPLVYYTYLAIKNKELNLPKSAWWLLAFTAIAFLSLVINLELIPKPSKNFGRLKYFLFGVGGIFVLRVWLKEASAKIKMILANIFFISLIAAAFATFYDFIVVNDGRANSFLHTMRYAYGSTMILLVMLTLLLWNEKPSWLDKRFAWSAFILGFAGMYITYTRGALLGFLCGLPFVLYFYRPKIAYIFGGAAIIGAFTLGGFYLFGSGNYQSRFLVNKNNSSDNIRRSQWQAAIIATKEKPVLGWGLSNFHSQLKRIKEQYDLDAKDFNDSHSHNLFLEIASGTGLVGLFFFLGWLIFWAIEVIKTGGLTRAALLPFGVAFVIMSQFEVTFDTNNASMIFFLYALSSIRGNHEQQS
jgi:O-antigen ligase